MDMKEEDLSYDNNFYCVCELIVVFSFLFAFFNTRKEEGKTYHRIITFIACACGGDNFLIGERVNRWKACLYYQPMNT